MLGEGIVSFGVPRATDLRKAKSSAKMARSRFNLPVTRIAAGVNSMSPCALWNLTTRSPGAFETPSSA